MNSLDELLGIDPSDPAVLRARRLLEADRRLVVDLTARRRQLGLSQAEVARRMDSTQSEVSLFESGRRDMHLSMVRRYAMAVEVMVLHVLVPDEVLS